MRVNNRLRRTIDAALGGMTLLASDPAKRFEAAQAVFKSRDASVLKVLESAIDKETDTSIKRAMQQARAAIVLHMADASEAAKIEAVAVIRRTGRPGRAQSAAAACRAMRRRR